MNPHRAALTGLCTTAALLGLALSLPGVSVAQATPHQRAAANQYADKVLTSSPATTYTVYLPMVERHGWVVVPLLNGGFEEDWSDQESHDALVFETEGTVQQCEVANIFTPPGWLVWFKHGMPLGEEAYNPEGQNWSQPEIRDARNTNPDRMHSGAKGQLLFTFWRIHDAGFLQRVDATPGQDVRLSGWAHAWSNNGGPPANPEDPEWSEGSHVGYKPFFALEGTEGLDDGDRNVTFWLGIDPLGGTNPYAETVVWGAGSHIYNDYHEVPAVTARAEGTTITVFLRSRTLWRFKHNDVYWDDIVLEVLR